MPSLHSYHRSIVNPASKSKGKILDGEAPVSAPIQNRFTAEVSLASGSDSYIVITPGLQSGVFVIKDAGDYVQQHPYMPNVLKTCHSENDRPLTEVFQEQAGWFNYKYFTQGPKHNNPTEQAKITGTRLIEKMDPGPITMEEMTYTYPAGQDKIATGNKIVKLTQNWGGGIEKSVTDFKQKAKLSPIIQQNFGFLKNRENDSHMYLHDGNEFRPAQTKIDWYGTKTHGGKKSGWLSPSYRWNFEGRSAASMNTNVTPNVPNPTDPTMEDRALERTAGLFLNHDFGSFGDLSIGEASLGGYTKDRETNRINTLSVATSNDVKVGRELLDAQGNTLYGGHDVTGGYTSDNTLPYKLFTKRANANEAGHVEIQLSTAYQGSQGYIYPEYPTTLEGYSTNTSITLPEAEGLDAQPWGESATVDLEGQMNPSSTDIGTDVGHSGSIDKWRLVSQALKITCLNEDMIDGWFEVLRINEALSDSDYMMMKDTKSSVIGSVGNDGNDGEHYYAVPNENFIKKISSLNPHEGRQQYVQGKIANIGSYTFKNKSVTNEHDFIQMEDNTRIMGTNYKNGFIDSFNPGMQSSSENLVQQLWDKSHDTILLKFHNGSNLTTSDTEAVGFNTKILLHFVQNLEVVYKDTSELHRFMTKSPKAVSNAKYAHALGNKAAHQAMSSSGMDLT